MTNGWENPKVTNDWGAPTPAKVWVRKGTDTGYGFPVRCFLSSLRSCHSVYIERRKLGMKDELGRERAG